MPATWAAFGYIVGPIFPKKILDFRTIKIYETLKLAMVFQHSMINTLSTDIFYAM